MTIIQITEPAHPHRDKKSICHEHGFQVLEWKPEGPVVALLGKRTVLGKDWRWIQVPEAG
jgi:hypothetical protein